MLALSAGGAGLGPTRQANFGGVVASDVACPALEGAY